MPKLCKTATDNTSYAPSHSSSLPGSVIDGKGPAKFFMRISGALKILIAMCQGLHNNHGDEIFTESEQPWKGMKVSAYCPLAVEYENEFMLSMPIRVIGTRQCFTSPDPVVSDKSVAVVGWSSNYKSNWQGYHSWNTGGTIEKCNLGPGGGAIKSGCNWQKMDR